jgi:hypothetical protein
MRYRAPLDWLNFSLADVTGGLGLHLGVFLLTREHWSQATIGAVMTASGLIGIAIHMPVGAFIDATRFKRGIIVAGVVMLAASALAITRFPIFPVVVAANATMAVAGAIFGPAVAAIAGRTRTTRAGGPPGPQRRVRSCRQRVRCRLGRLHWLEVLGTRCFLPGAGFRGGGRDGRALDPGPGDRLRAGSRPGDRSAR